MSSPSARISAINLLVAAAFSSVCLSGSAVADDVLAARLGELLGQEREALDIVPAAQLAALTLPPDPETRDIDVTALPAGDAEIAAATAGAVAQGDEQWHCLTEALYFEARGESDRGVYAVAEVILNRVESPAYPNTVCRVVNQGGSGLYNCQFTYNCDGIADRVREPAAWDRVGRIARAVLDGVDLNLTDGATHYHTTQVSPSWARRFPMTAQIGVHRFYRQPVQVAQN